MATPRTVSMEGEGRGATALEAFQSAAQDALPAEPCKEGELLTRFEVTYSNITKLPTNWYKATLRFYVVCTDPNKKAEAETPATPAHIEGSKVAQPANTCRKNCGSHPAE